jgi:hypothetical protein
MYCFRLPFVIPTFISIVNVKIVNRQLLFLYSFFFAVGGSSPFNLK